MLKVFPFLLLLLCKNVVVAQDFFDTPSNSPLPQSGTQDENILQIGTSRRIIILTNNSNVSAGDFVSLVYKDHLVVRAIVAKTMGHKSAIKVVKIYSPNRWRILKVNTQVQIIRGDDSFYDQNKKAKIETEEAENNAEKSNILSEDQLFTKDDLEIDDDEDQKQHVKADNIIGATYGQINSLDSSGGNKGYPHLSMNWAYQFGTNFWGEVIYGVSTLKSFPSSGLDTQLSNFSLRLKILFKLPLYSFVMPYLGYQYISVNSPDAGKQTEDEIDNDQLQREIDLVEQIRQNTVIFGVTFLKRLVPGWFLALGVGIDQVNAGVSIEY